jgi:hypothetical protein
MALQDAIDAGDTTTDDAITEVEANRGFGQACR